MNEILLNMHTTLSLSTPLLLDISVSSITQLYKVVSLYPLNLEHVCDMLTQSLSGGQTGVEQLGHSLGLFLVFLRLPFVTSTVAGLVSTSIKARSL